MAAWTSRSSKSSTSSFASYARNSLMLPAARTTSRRFGAVATCCANRARTRRKSPPRLSSSLSCKTPADGRGFCLREALSTCVGDGNQPRHAATRARQRGRMQIWRIEAALIRQDLESLGDADHRLGRAEDEIAVAINGPRQPIEQIGFGRLIEIDQHVAAEDHIKHA